MILVDHQQIAAAVDVPGCHHRKPLYFAVRENRIDVVRFLLEHDCNPLDLWMDDDPIEIARDRGYTEMEELLTHTLDTKFNASPQGEPVALALREHDLKQCASCSTRSRRSSIRATSGPASRSTGPQ